MRATIKKIVLWIAPVLILCGSGHVCAGRATPEQMKKMAKENQHLLKDLILNYKKVCAIYLRQGTQNAELVKQFTKTLNKAETDQEKAVLQYLLAEAHYWSAVAEIRKTRSRTAFQGVPDKVIGDLLKAYGSSRKVNADLPIRKDAAMLLFERLASGMCKKGLSKELKTSVIAQCIDVEELLPESPLSELPLRKKTLIYTNLGIQERLSGKLPAELPEGYAGLCKLLKTANDLGQKPYSLQVANQLWGSHQKKLIADKDMLRAVAQVFCKENSSHALESLLTLSKTDESAYLLLHHHSVLHNKEQAANKNPYEYLDTYLTVRRTKFPKSMDPYHRIVELLTDEKDYKGALTYIGKHEKQPDLQLKAGLPHLLLKKAECQEALGDITSAIESLELCKKKAWLTKGRLRIKAMADRRISKLKKIETKETK